MQGAGSRWALVSLVSASKTGSQTTAISRNLHPRDSKMSKLHKITTTTKKSMINTTPYNGLLS